MTPQEIFNKAYLGLRAQGKKSLNGQVGNDSRCLYAAPDGCHCGVGFLISPEVGRIWDEWYIGIDGIVMGQTSGVEPWMMSRVSLLNAIQGAHDSIRNWETEFEGNFKELAADFGLEVPE